MNDEWKALEAWNEDLKKKETSLISISIGDHIMYAREDEFSNFSAMAEKVTELFPEEILKKSWMREVIEVQMGSQDSLYFFTTSYKQEIGFREESIRKILTHKYKILHKRRDYFGLFWANDINRPVIPLHFSFSLVEVLEITRKINPYHTSGGVFRVLNYLGEVDDICIMKILFEGYFTPPNIKNDFTIFYIGKKQF